jgi:hypothetical protein
VVPLCSKSDLSTFFRQIANSTFNLSNLIHGRDQPILGGPGFCIRNAITPTKNVTRLHSIAPAPANAGDVHGVGLSLVGNTINLPHDFDRRSLKESRVHGGSVVELRFGVINQIIGAWMLLALVLLGGHRDAGAVHEDDLPGPCLFLQEG